MLSFFALTASSQTQEEVFDVTVEWNGTYGFAATLSGAYHYSGAKISITNITNSQVVISYVDIILNGTNIGRLINNSFTISPNETFEYVFNVTNPSYTPSGTLSAYISFKVLGDTNKIDQLYQDKNNKTFYDMNGNTITTPKHKGIYIVNGKKVMWK